MWFLIIEGGGNLAIRNATGDLLKHFDLATAERFQKSEIVGYPRYLPKWWWDVIVPEEKVMSH